VSELSGVSLRGAVDLAAVAARAKRQAAPPREASPYLVDVTEATFAEIVQRSTVVPVILVLGSGASAASSDLVATCEKLARESEGAFLVAYVDVDAEPGIGQAFQLQAVPAAIALIGGRPAPLFQGAADEAQLREVFAQVIAVATQSGITGRVGDAAVPPDAPEVPAEPPLPPLHQAAFDAIERGDFDAAAEAYRKALRESPKDADAKAGLAQVGLLQRTAGSNLAAALAEAEAAPDDAEAQLRAADQEVMAGASNEAFARLIAVVRRERGDLRELVRVRLVELFEVVGGGDPSVVAARRDLAAALF